MSNIVRPLIFQLTPEAFERNTELHDRYGLGASDMLMDVGMEGELDTDERLQELCDAFGAHGGDDRVSWIAERLGELDRLRKWRADANLVNPNIEMDIDNLNNSRYYVIHNALSLRLYNHLTDEQVAELSEFIVRELNSAPLNDK